MFSRARRLSERVKTLVKTNNLDGLEELIDEYSHTEFSDEEADWLENVRMSHVITVATEMNKPDVVKLFLERHFKQLSSAMYSALKLQRTHIADLLLDDVEAPVAEFNNLIAHSFVFGYSAQLSIACRILDDHRFEPGPEIDALIKLARNRSVWIPFLRDKVITATIGLQGLNLPALVTVHIVDELNPFSTYTPFHTKWNWVTKVKHFKSAQK